MMNRPEYGYKTAVGDSVQGKQKLYFCSHPEDFDLYFKKISTDIFHNCDNCAIFYRQRQHLNEDGDLAFSLREMRAFIVPLTVKFLTQDSFAMSEEIPIAKKNHIPIIPIAFGSEIKELIGEKLGKVQYLRDDPGDTTAISYSEKLKKRLKALVLGTEEENRIKEEFAAHIFMSYRKVDREHAQHVMKQIHDVDFCRDVAIWYDEFLVPGENYNKAIEQSMERADVFALTITPNALTPDNYMARVEYKFAKDHKKDVILPLEAVETKELMDSPQFTGISEPTDPNNRQQLEEQLEIKLIHNAKKEELLTPNDDPEHLYLMGLAYKNGVDLCSDPQRALELLNTSALTYRPAMLTLAEMYEFGDSVEINYEKAIRFYDRYIDSGFGHIGENEDNDISLLEAFFSKGDICKLRGYYEAARDTYEKSRTVIAGIMLHYGFRNQFFYIVCFERLGDIYSALEDNEKSLYYYEQQLDVLNLVQDCPSNLKINCLGRIADLQKKLGNTAASDEAYQKIDKLIQELPENKESENTIYAQGVFFERQADQEIAEGKTDDAMMHYFAAESNFTKLAEGTQKPEYQKSLAIVKGKIGSALADIGGRKHYLDAEEYLLESYQIKKKLAHPEDVISQRSLSVSCSQLYMLYLNHEEYEKAGQYLEEDLEIAKLLAEIIGTDQAHFELGQSYYNFHSLKTLSVEKRFEYIRKALEIFRKLQEKSPSQQYLEHRDMAAVLLYQFAKELKEQQEEVKDDNDDILASSEKMLQQVQNCLSNKEFQMKCNNALKMVRKLMKDKNNESLFRDLTIAKIDIGDSLVNAGKVTQAKEFYEKDLAINLRRVRKEETERTLDDFAISCWKLGELHCLDKKQRMRYLEEAANTWMRAYRISGDGTYYSNSAAMIKKRDDLETFDFLKDIFN